MTTKPLTVGQQLILQEILASHVVTQDEAMKLFERHNDNGLRSLEECFRDVNSQLSVGFGLEVASISLQGSVYHSIINKHADDVAKTSFSSRMNPHQYEFVRQVFRRLVEEDGKASRVDLINAKNSMKEPFKQLGLDESERMIDLLVDEKWLVCFGDGNRRASMSQEYGIGPRAYLELSHILTDFGMEDLPQFFFHRN